MNSPHAVAAATNNVATAGVAASGDVADLSVDGGGSGRSARVQGVAKRIAERRAEQLTSEGKTKKQILRRNELCCGGDMNFFAA